MKTKIILVVVAICFTTILFSQTSANINFGKGADCRGNQGICTFQKVISNKIQSNTKIAFDKDNNELTLIIYKTDTTNKLKITTTELEKGFYLYSFNENFDLPKNILSSLGITNKTKIKKGNYLVKEQGDKLIMKLKLE